MDMPNTNVSSCWTRWCSALLIQPLYCKQASLLSSATLFFFFSFLGFLLVISLRWLPSPPVTGTLPVPGGKEQLISEDRGTPRRIWVSPSLLPLAHTLLPYTQEGCDVPYGKIHALGKLHYGMSYSAVSPVFKHSHTVEKVWPDACRNLTLCFP